MVLSTGALRLEFEGMEALQGWSMAEGAYKAHEII